MSQDEAAGGEYTIGFLAGQMKAMNEQLANIRSDYKAGDAKADKSRENVHRRLDEITTVTGDLSTRTSHLETGIKRLTGEVSDMRSVTDDVKKMREQARGAGTLGHWLIKFGGWVLGAAGTREGLRQADHQPPQR